MNDTTTAWAHLPNAAHIDRILADVAQRPEAWGVSRGPMWYVAAWSAAWDAAQTNATRKWALLAVRGAVWTAARGRVRDDLADSILALVAWDDAGPLLDTPVPALRLYAANGSHAAVLMLPAAIALGDHS
jgi:hypothetical protein